MKLLTWIKNGLRIIFYLFIVLGLIPLIIVFAIMALEAFDLEWFDKGK